MRGLVTAFRTLTIFPIPGKDAEDFAAALPYFPAVGAVLGLLAVAIAAAFTWLGWAGGAGVVVTVALLLCTRGLHLDGLADAADAVGGGRTRERRLEIMKDPHVGSFGAAAIGADLLIKASCLGRVASAHAWAWLIVAMTVSRTCMVLMAVTLPYARATGGTAAPFVRNASLRHLLYAVAAAGALCLIGPSGLALLAIGAATALALRPGMRRAFGGITGDLLGTTNEVVECVLFILLGLFAPDLPKLGWALLF